MTKLITPFRVGLLVITGGLLLLAFLTFARKNTLGDKNSVQVYAYFNDATGLGKKSLVQIAGIKVGELEDFKLEPVLDPITHVPKSKAKITMRISKELVPNLSADAALTKRSEGLLGDYMLELYPGSDKAPPLEDGGEIKNVFDQGGMQAIFTTLQTVTSDIEQVTASLRKVLGGEKGTGSMERIVDNLVKLSDTIDKTVRESAERLDTILANVQTFSNEIKSLGQGEEGNIKHIIENVDNVTKDTREVLATVKKILGSGEGDLKESVASLKETLDRLNKSLVNVEEITDNVKAGRGAVGTLLSDERLGQKISETVEGVSDFAGRLTNLQAEVGIKSEYLVNQGNAKNTLSIKLTPRPDKYYLIEVVDDPRGTVTTQTVQSNPPSVGTPTTQTQTITTQTLKYSAQFAKRFYFTTLRFGLIESTGGVGMDLNVPVLDLWRDMITLKFDAFNFSVDYLKYPRLRATLRVQLFEHVALTGGVDDMLNGPVRDSSTHTLLYGRDYFFGAGIFFTDDDLKSVLAIAPKP